jgi:hypothetical protein
MKFATNDYRQKLQVLLDELPATEIREVYHFTVFLHTQMGKEEPPATFPTVPVSHLRSLSGLIEVGGDAVQDTEDLYHA